MARVGGEDEGGGGGGGGSERTLRVGTWNVARALAFNAERGARSREDVIEGLLEWMVEAGVTVLGLQETGIGPRKDGMEAVKGAVRRWAKRAGIQAGIWMACGDTKRRSQGGARAGVALLMLGRWSACVQSVRRWKSGRAVCVDLQLGSGRSLWVAAAYAPTGHEAVHRARKAKFLEQMGAELDDATERRAGRKMVLIDANYHEEEVDHERGHGEWREGREWREEQGLADTWRVRHAGREGFTREHDGHGSTRMWSTEASMIPKAAWLQTNQDGCPSSLIHSPRALPDNSADPCRLCPHLFIV